MMDVGNISADGGKQVVTCGVAANNDLVVADDPGVPCWFWLHLC